MSDPDSERDAGTTDGGDQPETKARPTLEEGIAKEVRRLRQSHNLSLAELARRVGLSRAMMSQIENAQTSCSLSTLSRLSQAFDVPLSVFFRDVEGPRDAVFTPAGQGGRFYGRDNKFTREYQMLGSFVSQSKHIEPLLVTMNDPDDIEYSVVSQPGVVFLYMLEGVMVYRHGDVDYRLGSGDSLLLDGGGWRGPRELVRLPVKYLSLIVYPDN